MTARDAVIKVYPEAVLIEEGDGYNIEDRNDDTLLLIFNEPSPQEAWHVAALQLGWSPDSGQDVWRTNGNF
jgi:hypothetical protein